jgi:hypothetical protein
MLRLMRTLVVLGLSLGVFQFYALFARNFVKPQIVKNRVQALQETQQGRIQGPADHIEIARKYLSDQPWAQEAKIQFRSKNQIFFCGEWKRSNDNAQGHTVIRFQPFAVVSLDPDKPDAQPVTMVAQSALVEFSKSLDLTEIDPRWISRGAMDGQVRIQGADGLTIVGRDFIYDREANHVRSDHQVQFNYNGQTGSAQSIEMELLRKEDDNPDEVSFQGVQKIHLHSQVMLQLREKPDEPLTTISSRGSMDLLLEQKLARLVDNVKVLRTEDNGDRDQMTCDQLEVYFKEQVKLIPAQEQASTTPDGQLTDTSPRTKKEWRPSFMKAHGKKLEVFSSQNAMQIVGETLEYDLEKRSLHLSHPHLLQISLQQKEDIEIACQRLEITHDDRSQLQTLKIPGAGLIKAHQPGLKTLAYDVQWNQELVLAPDTQLTQIDRLSMLGQVIFRHYEQKSGIKAETIQIWLNHEKKGGPKVASNDRMQGSMSRKPIMLQAQNDVTVISPDIDARLNLLEVQFNEVAGTDESTEPEKIEPYAVQQVNGQNQPGKTQTSLMGSGSGPLNLRANTLKISARTFTGGGDMKWNDIRAEGQVEADVPGTEKQGTTTIKGDILNVHAQAGEPAHLQLLGGPAQILNPEMSLSGQDLQWDHRKQMMTINKGGQIDMLTTKSLRGDVLEQPEKMTLTWTEQVIFNGKTGRFFGHVVASLGGGHIQTEELEIELDREINLQDPPKSNKEVTIRQLICRGRTQFHLNELTGQDLTSVSKADVAEFVVNLETKKCQAQGPGWMCSWRYGKSQVVQVAPKKDSGSTSSSDDTPKMGWSYTRVNFDGRMEGDLQFSTGTLYDRVRAIHGPVQKPLDMIDADKLPPQAVWMAADRLDVGQINSPDQKDATYELDAHGNVEIRGELFHAEGQTVTFDQAKQLFTLRADDEYAAMIARRERIGGPWDYTYANLIRFSPVNNTLSFDRVKRIKVGRSSP